MLDILNILKFYYIDTLNIVKFIKNKVTFIIHKFICSAIRSFHLYKLLYVSIRVFFNI